MHTHGKPLELTDALPTRSPRGKPHASWRKLIAVHGEALGHTRWAFRNCKRHLIGFSSGPLDFVVDVCPLLLNAECER